MLLGRGCRNRQGAVGFVVAVFLGFGPLQHDAVENPEEFPNLLAGSFTEGLKFSTGNTLPLICRPWGFNHWTPQTNEGKTSWFFSPVAHEFRWLRMTHQPSPWMGDWAWMQMGPQMGGLVEEPVMFWEPMAARFKPHVFDARLGPDNMRIQVTPTEHAAIVRITFPELNPRNLQKRVCFRLPPPDKKQLVSGTLGKIDGQEMWMELISRRANDVPPYFGVYVRAQVDKRSLKHTLQIAAAERISGTRNMHCFEFHPREGAINIFVASSLISEQQAQLNLEREVMGKTFEEVEEDAKLVWREMLGRIDVVDAGGTPHEAFKRLSIFYTGLYRFLTFPRRIDEVDAQGKVIHYSPYAAAGAVVDGIGVTDNGFWDTFRTVYPLLNLAYPKESGEIITGWLNAYKAGGWLPEWASPGYRQCMTGTYADVVVADAVLKGIPGINTDVAWEAVEKDSFTSGGGKKQGGKSHYKEYSDKGYIPADKSADSVSNTLDFAYSDFAVALMAEKLGHAGPAKSLRDRALAARQKLYDHSSGLMKPVNSAGLRVQSDPAQWGSGYVEGSAWAHSFPSFDLAGLAALHGTRDNLAHKIADMLKAPGTFTTGTYRQVIHEMEEMRAQGTGQYAHSNQPGHHILWLLLALDTGKPECNAAQVDSTSSEGPFCPRQLGESVIFQVLQDYGLEYFAGDEDNGEMGAWYVLGALGLYDPSPGSEQGYVMGSPLFRRVDFYRNGRGNKPSLSIRSHQAGAQHPLHVSNVMLNGKEVATCRPEQHGMCWSVSYSDLVSVGDEPTVLRFVTKGESLDDSASLAQVPQQGVPLEPSKGNEAAQLSGEMAQLRQQQQRRTEEYNKQVQDLQHVIEEQAEKLRSALKAQTQPPAPAAPAQGPDGHTEEQVLRTQLKQQWDHIQKLEGQLRQQQSLFADQMRQSQMFAAKRPLYTASPAAGPEPDDTMSLAIVVEAAVCVVVMLNIFGWFLCLRGKHKRQKADRKGHKHRHHQV